MVQGGCRSFSSRLPLMTLLDTHTPLARSSHPVDTFFIVGIHEFYELKLWNFYIKGDVEREPGKLATLRKGRSSGPRGRDAAVRTVVAAHFSAFGGLLSWDLNWLGPVTLWSLTRLTHPFLSSPVPLSHPLSPLGEAGIAELCWLLSFEGEKSQLRKCLHRTGL